MKPWEGYMEPFRIFGNLYFIGTRFVSVHMLDTNDGLVLIDSGYPQCVYLTLENIRKLGFNPYDIKHIVITHGHYDHLGGARAIKELTGAKIYLGKEDVDYANGTRDLTWAKELGYEYYEMFEPDVLISDGDVITFGNNSIRFVHTPGHTEGCKSLFFDVTDGENTYKVAMFGGAGMNSISYDFLDKYGLPHSLRDDLVCSLQRVRDEKVDILIGNHPGDAQTQQKYERILAGEENPFLDRTAWHRRLDYIKGQFDDMVASGR